MTASTQGTAPHWPASVRVLHWLMAAALILQWFAGEFDDAFGGSGFHVSLGLTLFALLLVRLVLRLLLPSSPPPATSPGWERLAARLVQWAWYLLLGLAGAYLVFRAKRRQRIIPVLPKNENSSYEFISTIANLHFREKNYQNLCVQNMRLFLAQVRERYGLVAQLDADSLKPRIDAAFLERLSQVAEVPVKQIQDIFTQYTAAVQYEPTEDMMIQLHLAMERFFKQAK